MIRMVPLKTLQAEYVADLDQYVTMPSRFTRQERDLIIAATMSAARVFTFQEKKAGVTGRIPMARSRGKKLLESHRRKGVDLVVRKVTELPHPDQK